MAVTHVTPAGGNLFAELGFDHDEAENLKVRACLMMALRKVIEARDLRQVDAGALFGVSQPRISDLMRGRMDAFTIDSLVNMLSHAGIPVEVSVPSVA